MTAPRDPVSSGSARGRRREAAILDAAYALLTDTGYERLTIDAVARAARASKATIYARWPRKAELIAAALEARFRAQPQTEFRGPDLRADLGELTRAFVEVAETESLPAFLSVVLAAGDEPVLAAALRGPAIEPRREDCRTVVRAAVDRGEIPASASAEGLFDLLLGRILTRYAIERGHLGEAEQRDFVERVLLPYLRDAG
jgi:AcrR family transcriptional regulator